jgi:hypothetical protein
MRGDDVDMLNTVKSSYAFLISLNYRSGNSHDVLSASEELLGFT